MSKQNKALFKKYSLLFHTVKYIKWQQIIYKCFYRFHKLKKKRMLFLQSRSLPALWSSPSYAESAIISETEVFFLGKSGQLIHPQDWNCPNKSKLWLYNLHYLDSLNSIDAEKDVDRLNQLIDRWIKENPPYEGNGWEPYTLSLRIVNLVKWFANKTPSLSAEWLTSLAQQAQALYQQLEYQILGNHLFANAKALIFVGTYFSGNKANFWLKKGLKILDYEINEQFLPDGGHFELSPMYQATLLWDLCDLVNLAQISGLECLHARRALLEEKIREGIKWLSAMSHPDGNISFFNDATFGVAPKLDAIVNYAQYLGLQLHKKEAVASVELLNDTGYCVVNSGLQAKAILDVGKVGPDYQPGHAHADVLSFELSVHGQRFLVNSGISEYQEGNLRQAQRSTRAHNTVTINDTDSSEVWAGFRVARRAYPFNLTIDEQSDKIQISCSHNGYLKLSGKNIHSRQWIFSPQSLIVNDSISGDFSSAEARFYFHPDVKIVEKNPYTLDCYLANDKKIAISIDESATARLEPSKWYPAFGFDRQNTCLVISFSTNELVTKIEWCF